MASEQDEKSMKYGKTFLWSLVATLLLTTGLCVAQDALPNEKQSVASSEWTPKEQSKAFVLLAWGAPSAGEPLRRQCADGERKKLEAAFARIKATASNRVVVKSLSADDSSYSNVYAECYRLAQEAKPNDAVFVYILTPTATLKGGDGLYRNGLAPHAPSTLNPDMKEVGIMRKTIRDALASSPHRLEALLVDVAPTFVLSTPYRVINGAEGAGDGTAKDDQLTYLARFLLEGKGALDVSSARPYRGQEREEPFAWVPYEWSSVNASAEVEQRSVEDRLSGTIFCNALLRVAETKDFVATDLSARAFAAKLADALQERNEALQKVFFAPRKQTLTQFGRKGAEILVKESEEE